MAVNRGFPVNVVGEDLKKLLRLLEEEEKSSNLGETPGPLLDLYETAEAVVVEADIPGMDPSSVMLCIFHGLLTIEGIKRERQEDEKVRYLCMERSFEPFKRIVRITIPVNPKKAKAVYARGVLTITFPKIEEKRGEAIRISIERAEDKETRE